MLRLRFTAEDLLRVRFASAPAPLLELGLAAAALQRTDRPATYGRWRAQLRRALPAQARPVLALVPPNGAGPLFLDPLSTGLEDGLDAVRSTSSATVVHELQRVCPAYRPVTGWVRALADQDREAWRTLDAAVRAGHRLLLEEQWPRVLAAVQADLHWRSQLLVRAGLGAVLASLYPGSTWTGSTLHVPYPRDVDVGLSEQGLTLMPSSFWSGQPLIGRDERGGDLLVYPALTPLPMTYGRAADDPLEALLGATRASVLRSAEHRTTGEIAAELGVSAASVSQHTRTLRESGLLSSRRSGKHVEHSRTALGDAVAAGPVPALDP